MKRFYLKVVFQLLAALCFVGVTYSQKKLLVLGSSTSQCFFGPSSTDSCYLMILQRHYNAAGTPFILDNRAVSGDNVYHGMPTNVPPPPGRNAPRPDSNITAGLNGNPDVVLVNYPSNGYDQFSVDEVLYCLRTIQNAANSRGIPCYITTSQPRNDPQSFRTDSVRKKMAAISNRVQSEFGAFAINFWDGIVNPADTTILPMYNADGTHLNNLGHRLLFERVLGKNIFSSSVLPLSFTGFTAAVSGNETVLQWATTGDDNIKTFQVRRSQDGMNFTTLESIKSLPKQEKFTFTDKNPFSAVSFYQILATDIQNVARYSAIVKVSHSSQSFSIQSAYFNNSFLVAKLESGQKLPVEIQVVNSSGQALKRMNVSLDAGINTIKIDASGITKGVYFLRVSNGAAGMRTRSFLKN